MRTKQKNKREKRKNKRLIPAACLLGSLLLYIALTIDNKNQNLISPEGTIRRESYGGNSKDYPLIIEGLEAETVSATIAVSPQAYTKQEALAAFEQVMETMEERIRGDNPSLMEVRSPLSLPSSLNEEGIRLRWHSSDNDTINFMGELKREVDTEKQVILTVELSAGPYRQNYEIPLRIVPPQKNPSQQKVADFLKELQILEQSQQTQPYFALPTFFQGKKLTYKTKSETDYRSILVLGILLSVLLTAREQNQDKQKQQKREQELLLDYADILSKLMVLIGAGMTIRNAWGQIVHDYETALHAGKKKQRHAYEEMRYTYYQLQSGTPEGSAYRDFGRRCRLQPYLKLSGLLDQNRKSGTKNMRTIFQTEMTDALEQRKNLARRMGEEAGTKLLLPLFLMLGIIMTMIMVPAMMTMG